MMRFLTLSLLALLASSFLSAQDNWQSRLYTPTHVEKLGDTYFIVVCFQHRILYSDDLSLPIEEWKLLDDTIAGPHSIDSDGEVFVAEDTGRHGLHVYREGEDGELSRVQTLGPFGKRTHRVRYDEATKAFYVISSNSQDMTKLIRDRDGVKVAYTKPLPVLENSYTRSMTIIGDAMYFTSGPGVITKVRYRDDSYAPLATYRVPEGMESANDVFRTSDGWWYVTSTPQRIVRARSLEELDEGNWEDVFETLGMNGTPYYLEEFDGRIFVPEITQYSALTSFVHGPEGEITDVKTHFDFGPPNDSDKERVQAFPR
ncbi:MAG: hypothetical protein AAF733_00190 [Verrucomicrobiota bacterium]